MVAEVDLPKDFCWQKKLDPIHTIFVNVLSHLFADVVGSERESGSSKHDAE